jgi:hypothetical protein
VSTINKDFRVKHGLIVEANTYLNGNLQVDGTINGLNVNAQAAYTQAAFDKANTGGGSANVGLYVTNDTFTANGLTGSFTLSVTPINEESTIINFDGITQQKSQYSLSGSTITFTETPNTGTLIEVSSFVNAGNGIFIATESGIVDNVARDTANASFNTANSAGLYANSGITLAQASYNQGNSTATVANTAVNDAASASIYANTGINNAASASLYANAGITLAQAAFDQANTGGGSLPSNIVANSITSNTYVSIPYAIMTTGLAYANTAGSNTKVDNFSTTIFRGAKYNIQITSDSGYQISELSLIQHDTDVMISEYGVVCSNTSVDSLGTFYANVSSGIVNLNFNGVSGNNVVAVYKVGIANTGISGAGGGEGPVLPEDLMTGSGTIDLSSGSGTIDLN